MRPPPAQHIPIPRLQCASNSPPSVWRYYERNKSPQKDTLAAFLPQTENWELDSAYPHAEMGKPEDKARSFERRCSSLQGQSQDGEASSLHLFWFGVDNVLFSRETPGQGLN